MKPSIAINNVYTHIVMLRNIELCVNSYHGSQIIEMLLMTQSPFILGIPQNLKLSAREQGVTVAHHCNKSNTDSCTVSSRRAAANSSPCQHDGVCEQGWFRPICMCERTAYYGSTCHQGTYLYSIDSCC